MLRVIFGVVSLVVVLAMVGLLAKKQLHLVQLPAQVAASGTAVDEAPARQAQTVQRKVQDDVNKALEQAKRRNESAGGP